MAKKRKLRPVDYCDRPAKKRRIKPQTDEEKQIDDLMERIKIKSERLTNLKAAVRILNRENDQNEIIDVEDLDEFNQLLDDDYIPQSSDVDTSISPADIDENGDCIMVTTRSKTTQRSTITSGIDARVLEVDRDLSVEYSYTTDVSIDDADFCNPFLELVSISSILAGTEYASLQSLQYQAKS